MNKREKEEQEALDAQKMAMRELIRAANHDKRLIENKNWQDVMMHLNRLIGEPSPNLPWQAQVAVKQMHQNQRKAA